jgi:hypothetical protein
MKVMPASSELIRSTLGKTVLFITYHLKVYMLASELKLDFPGAQRPSEKQKENFKKYIFIVTFTYKSTYMPTYLPT